MAEGSSDFLFSTLVSYWLMHGRASCGDDRLVKPSTRINLLWESTEQRKNDDVSKGDKDMENKLTLPVCFSLFLYIDRL